MNFFMNINISPYIKTSGGNQIDITYKKKRFPEFIA
jgi:hypothetical protein